MFGNMFKGAKNKMMLALVKKQMKNMPKEQQDMVIALVTENPELFEKMGKEIKALTKAGKNEQYASMEVMQKYRDEIQQAVSKYQNKAQRPA